MYGAAAATRWSSARVTSSTLSVDASRGPLAASIRRCGSNPTSTFVTTLLKPLNTERTMISAATPTVIPITETSMMMLMKRICRFDRTQPGRYESFEVHSGEPDGCDRIEA